MTLCERQKRERSASRRAARKTSSGQQRRHNAPSSCWRRRVLWDKPQRSVWTFISFYKNFCLPSEISTNDQTLCPFIASGRTEVLTRRNRTSSHKCGQLELVCLTRPSVHRLFNVNLFVFSVLFLLPTLNILQTEQLIDQTYQNVNWS